MPKAIRERIRQVFSEAAEMERTSRPAFLAQACGDDPDVRQEVERLLNAFDETVEILGGCSAGEFLFVHSPHLQTLLAGDRVGRFVIVRLLGRGGFGEVYEAEDLDFGGRVALKTLRPEFLSRPDIAARFLREIQLARKVAHPNLCRIHDVGRHAVHDIQIAYLTMELLAGETLSDRLKRGVLTPREALPVIRQLVCGLGALHDAKVIHRDLKPSNVVLVASDNAVRAVITDFGLAHGVALEPGADSLTLAGDIIGTPAYMAPEQLTGKPVGPRADVFSLGIVMYEMLCGTRPFTAQQFVESATQKLSVRPAPPSRYARLDARWDALILSCLECDADRRPQSTAELLSHLDLIEAHAAGKRSFRILWSSVSTASIRRSLLFAGLAATVGTAIPLQFPAVRTPILRRMCEQMPGYALFCELPADKDMAVLPFAIKTSATDDLPLATGVARYVRESFERLAPQPESLCVHLRSDKLTDGVRLAVEGEVETTSDSVTLRYSVREATASTTKQPLILRRSQLTIRKANAKELHTEALRRLARALAIDYPERERAAWSQSAPSHSESFLAHLTGLGYLEQGKYQEATQAFTAAIDPDFAFAPAHVGLGDAYRLLGNKTGNETWARRARQAYQRAVPLDRDFGFAGAEKRWGDLEAGLGDTQAALPHLDAALQLWPYDHLLRKSASTAYEAATQLERAEQVLREGVQLTPQCWLAHNALADYYWRRSGYQEAEKELLEVVRLAPNNANAYHNLALNYRLVGRVDDAIEMALRSIRVGLLPIAYSTLGRAFLYRGCSSDALVNLRKAVELAPAYYLLWANLAEGLSAAEPAGAEAQRVFARTVELSREALERTPSYAYPRVQHALNLARLGQRDTAIEHAERAVSQSPGTDVLSLAAETFEVAGFRSKALEQLERALREGLPLYQAETQPGLIRLRRDAGYRGILQRLNLRPAADPGGLTPSPRKSCPESSIAGTGLGGV